MGVSLSDLVPKNTTLTYRRRRRRAAAGKLSHILWQRVSHQDRNRRTRMTRSIFSWRIGTLTSIKRSHLNTCEPNALTHFISSVSVDPNIFYTLY